MAATSPTTGNPANPASGSRTDNLPSASRPKRNDFITTWLSASNLPTSTPTSSALPKFRLNVAPGGHGSGTYRREECTYYQIFPHVSTLALQAPVERLELHEGVAGAESRVWEAVGGKKKRRELLLLRPAVEANRLSPATSCSGLRASSPPPSSVGSHSSTASSAASSGHSQPSPTASSGWFRPPVDCLSPTGTDFLNDGYQQLQTANYSYEAFQPSPTTSSFSEDGCWGPYLYTDHLSNSSSSSSMDLDYDEVPLKPRMEFENGDWVLYYENSAGAIVSVDKGAGVEVYRAGQAGKGIAQFGGAYEGNVITVASN